MKNVVIQEADFDLNSIYAALRDKHGADIGAMVAFVGLVRDRNKKAGSGDAVQTLTLEHYPGMTEKSIEAIITKAVDRWPLLDLVVIHRVGTLAPADQIVGVVSVSAHRDAAFAAAEFVMDYLKTDAVFWKREATSAGSQWIESTDDDRSRAEHWK